MVAVRIDTNTARVNFTRTSSFWAGRVFIQHVRFKQNKICINLIYTRPLRIFYVINYVTVNYSLVGGAISKIINNVV